MMLRYMLSFVMVLAASGGIRAEQGSPTDEAAGRQEWSKRDIREYGDQLFCRGDFDAAALYYELALSDLWRCLIPSEDAAISEHARYRLALIEENRRDYGGEPLAMYAEAMALDQLGLRDQKQEHLEWIKQLYPDSAIVDDVDLALAERLRYTGGLEGLANHWEKFLSKHPASPLRRKAEKGLARTYENLAIKEQDAGRDDEVEKWYERFIQLPAMTGEDVYLRAAKFFETRGRLDLAEQAYKMDVHGGGWPKAYSSLGLFYERHYRLEEYVSFLQQEGRDVGRFLREMQQEKEHETLSLFPQAYDFRDAQSLSRGDIDILLELYKRKDELQDFHRLAEFVVRISSGGCQLLLPIESALYERMFRANEGYYSPDLDPPIVCIRDPSGGNAWNANPWYVVSLQQRSFLKKVGKVAQIRDYDGDGTEDLIRYEDIWEGGLGWFCHAGAPAAIICYRVEDGRLVRDAARNAQRWKSEIDQFDARIRVETEKVLMEGQVEIAEPIDSGLLHSILSKFLRFRLLDELEKGWQELHNDLGHRDEQYFFFTYSDAKRDDAEPETRKFPVQRIEEAIETSLQNYRARDWRW
jgi:hypothetical protein